MSKYDDYDWAELSDEVKRAAEKLGYTDRKWDKGTTVETEDYDWDELTEEQQEAATVLGYTKEMWDAED